MVSNSWKEIDGKQVDSQGVLQDATSINYIGQYVNASTVGLGKGMILEIENISDGRIWANIYLHNENSSQDTIKGKLEGVKLENGVANGTYEWSGYGYYGLGDEWVESSSTGTFTIKLKKPDECSYERLRAGEQYGDLEYFSPISMRLDNRQFEDYYSIPSDWDVW